MQFDNSALVEGAGAQFKQMVDWFFELDRLILSSASISFDDLLQVRILNRKKRGIGKMRKQEIWNFFFQIETKRLVLLRI